MNKIFTCILIAVISFLLSGCERKTVFVTTEETRMDTEVSHETEHPATEEQLLACYVCGAVLHPGVYYVSEGAIKQDAIALAGGFAGDAAESYLNLAEPVAASEKIYVPTEDELSVGMTGTGAQGSDTVSDGLVHINRATKEELMTLPGIGDRKASAIISYRESIGGYQSTEQIMEVDGIKQGTFDAIKDMIAID